VSQRIRRLKKEGLTIFLTLYNYNSFFNNVPVPEGYLNHVYI